MRACAECARREAHLLLLAGYRHCPTAGPVSAPQQATPNTELSTRQQELPRRQCSQQSADARLSS